MEEILAGQAKPAVFARLLQAPFDERLSLVSLLLAGLDTRFTASLQADAVADACYAFLRETKKALATLPEDIPTALRNCSASRSRTTKPRPSKSATPVCWARQS